MTIHFLIKLKYYRENHLTLFYVFSYLILIFRIINFAFAIYLTSKGFDEKHGLRFLDRSTGVIASYFNILLGIV
jgi:hypothetical protein